MPLDPLFEDTLKKFTPSNDTSRLIPTCVTVPIVDHCMVIFDFGTSNENPLPFSFSLPTGEKGPTASKLLNVNDIYSSFTTMGMPGFPRALSLHVVVGDVFNHARHRTSRSRRTGLRILCVERHICATSRREANI